MWTYILFYSVVAALIGMMLFQFFYDVAMDPPEYAVRFKPIAIAFKAFAVLGVVLMVVGIIVMMVAAIASSF